MVRSTPSPTTDPGRGSAGWSLIAMLVLAFLLGGSSRADTGALIVLRPLAAVAFVAALGMVLRRRLGSFAAPLGLLGGWFLLTAMQLVPLPPDVWTSLPGRDALAASYALLGISPGWKPLSVVPMATLNSLLALFVPLSVLMFYTASDREGSRRALAVFVGLVGLSALVGIAQVIGGRDWLYIYRVTNEGFPVGLFANRNHQAALLAAAIPMLLALTGRDGSDGRARVARWGGRMAALALAAMAVMTGSRTGAVLALASMAGASLLFAGRADAAGPRSIAGGSALQRFAVPAILLFSVAGMFLVYSGTAFERMADKDGLGDIRFQILPIVWRMIADSFPFGFGFGTFAEVYKIYEPANIMIAQYINRAHNDWVEVVLEGGLAAACLALSMAAWFVGRCWHLRDAILRPRGAGDRLHAAAAIGLVVLVAASLFDYPLRTPAGAAVLALLLGCLASPRSRA